MCKLTFLAVDFDGGVGAYDGEGDSFLESLLTSVLVFVLGVGEFVDLDTVLSDFVENRLLEGGAFIRSQSVGFGDQRNDVHFVVEALHEFDVERLQPDEGGKRQYMRRIGKRKKNRHN